MGIYVYPTDERWFRFLQARSPLDEVNFWQPGGSRPFTQLQTGDLFLFRLRSPINKIAGGGIFLHGSVFPIHAAWEAFGEKNGMPSYAELFATIEQYRRKNNAGVLRDDSRIGCIILKAPFFLQPKDWLDVPSDYHLNLVQGKNFSVDSSSGRVLFDWARGKVGLTAAAAVSERIPGPIFGEPVLGKRRLGQGAFRVMVSDAYERRCAITGERTFPVLEAAHIQPVSKGGEHRMDNGILLRSDLHKLFDLGYVTITPKAEFRVSPKLRDTWLNGRVYYALDGTSIRLPDREVVRPSASTLEWHNDTVFRT